MSSRTAGALMLAAIAGYACGSDPVAYSEPISLKLSGIKPGDIKNSAFTEDKNVNTETNNPYNTFMINAQAQLDGKNPSAIEVEKITLSVGSDSKGIGSDGFATVCKTIETFIGDSTSTVVLGNLEQVEATSTEQ